VVRYLERQRMSPISSDVFQWRMRHAFGYQKQKLRAEPDCTAQGERSPDFVGVTLPPIHVHIAAQEQLDSQRGLLMDDNVPRPT
jgi:hypothetical protein